MGRMRVVGVVASLILVAALGGCRPRPPAAGGDAAPPRRAEPAVATSGESPPAPGEPTALPTPAAPTPAPADGPAVLTDRRWGFRLTRPAAFVLREREPSELAGFDPAPAASYSLMNPTMAAGELAGLEPPDLELRVFTVDEGERLESWLGAAGLTGAGDTARPYREGRTPGLEVCRATLMAPGCSVFFRAGSRIFQLAAISIEGETMIRSFEILQ